MSFGMFGSIFLLAQFFQTVQGYSPLGSGLRILPWTAMPMIVAPIAGALSDRIGGQPHHRHGLALQAIGLAWIAAVSTPTTPYVDLVAAVRDLRHRHGALLRSDREPGALAVRREEEGQASGANNAIRELGGVFGVAVLASVFSHYGGYRAARTFVNGMTPAVYLGAAVVALGAVAAFAIKRRPRARCSRSSRSKPPLAVDPQPGRGRCNGGRDRGEHENRPRIEPVSDTGASDRFARLATPTSPRPGPASSSPTTGPTSGGLPRVPRRRAAPRPE